MPSARPNLTRPLPRPGRPRPIRHVATPDTGPARGSTIAQQITPWSFAARVYIAFDPPSSTNPTWIEATEFVDATSIVINRGRQDGMADVNVGTCTLVVDNTDGRWTPSNPNGAWYGQIKKGAWLRVDLLPLSGNLSRRFTGFITALPTGWAGLYASTRVSASDRFLLLGQAPQFFTMVQQEAMSDASGNLVCYYSLTEASDSLTAGDTSGALNPAMTRLSVGGVPLGTGLSLGATQGPGFDGQQAPTWNPGTTTQGTILQTSLPTQGSGVWAIKVSCWINTTYQNAQNPIFSLVDPIGGGAVTLLIDANGSYLDALYAWTSPNATGPTTTWTGNNWLHQAPPQLNDGRWHHVSVIFWPATGSRTGMPTGYSALDTFEDGLHILGELVFNTDALSTNMTQLIVGGGMSVATAGIISTFTGSISDVQISYAYASAPAFAMLNEPSEVYTAAYSGFAGESVDQRILRLARYAGVPEPAAGGAAPWVNLSPCVHLTGTQSITGRQPLDVMREAARAEQMPVYIDVYGNLTIQPCTTRYDASAPWSVNALDIDPSTTFSDDFQYLVNQVTVTPNGGASQTINGAAGYASQAKYGVYSQSIQTASINTYEAANAAMNGIVANADPVPRIAPLVIEAATLATQTGYGASWYDQVLATDISTVVTVTGLPSQAPAPSMSVFVEGYSETIGMGTHVFSFSTSPQVFTSVLQLDSATLGTLDTPGITLAY